MGACVDHADAISTAVYRRAGGPIMLESMLGGNKWRQI
jgi:hypothetical protein